MTIVGCRVKEKIYESRNALVYRAHQEAENRPVILKMLKQAYPPPKKIAAFRREYELIRSLQSPGVISAYNLATDQHRPVIVLEDFGGKSLAQFLQARRLPLADALSLAIEIADVVGQVHRQHVIHKDVNPSNLVWNPTTDQLKLIDFGVSTPLTREDPILSYPIGSEGTLAYISPEQTGRMNRAVDYRTDFYSLGVTIYELLTGQLPFPTSDELALVHAHIAQQPIPPHQIAPDIPQPLSSIVMKLMAKNAEDRYQSAHGIKADLEECLRQWRTGRKVDPFLLGEQDATDRFHIPQKLYGREAEIDTLLTVFERVSQGASEIILVSGYAGIGKSALVREVYKPLTLKRGYFAAGKFDQLHRDIPYVSLAQAFRSLMRQLLTESGAQITTWREKLLAALGPNGKVIVDVIPELELLIGPQSPAPSLPPAETQNRFHLAFQNFVRVFTEQGRPLVIFLDDLQWADAASLTLLQLLMTTPENRSLLIIGAYRDNEVRGAHPLQLVLDEVRKGGRIVSHIVLGPLGLPNVQQWIADTLACTPERAAPLAGLVLAKTNGNPFFIKEFLESLYEERLLTFSAQRREWQWDVARIKVQDITDNVVELMASRMQKLGGRTREVLKLAACIGNQFALRTLTIVYEKSPSETATDLWPAIVEGLVAPLSEAYALANLEVQGLTDEIMLEYKFAHDRVQQAAYSLIPQAERPAVHRRVGRLLLRNMLAEEREQNMFDIISHLNVGRGLIEQRAEQEELATLNLAAGKRAKAAAAYKPALHYLLVGVELLPEDAWERRYDLALALYIETAEAAYLSADFERMERLSEIVLRQAKTLLDKVRVYEINIHACTARNKLLEGIKTGLKVLELLGIKFPEKPTQEHITRALAETKRALARKRIEDLRNLAEMADLYKLATMRILSGMVHLTKIGFPELFPLVVCQAVNLSVKHGNTPLSAQAYAAYGLILCGMTGDIDDGYQFGELALDLVEQFNAKELKTSTVYIVASFIQPWKEHIGVTLNPLLEGYQLGLETGDLNFAAMSVFGYLFKAYWIGNELTWLEREIVKYNETIDQFKKDFIRDLNRLYRQVVLNLLGRSEDPCCLVGESYDEAKMLPLWLKANNRNAICHIYLNKLILCYLFQAYSRAAEHAVRTEEYLDSLSGTVAIPPFYLYDSLAKLAVWFDTQESERERLLEKVAANQKKMELWAHHAPMNCLHKFYLVEAERARVLGNESEAREYYDRAIDLAREQGYVNEEALANELAAKFYLARGQARLAQHYLRDAHYAYVRWGALAKVKDVETRYPQFLDQAKSSFSQTGGIILTASTEQRLLSSFDFTSVLHASQAISSEIHLDKLLTKLMTLVIENAGAQRALLILDREGQLVIEAEGVVGKGEVAMRRSVPVEGSPDLPIAIVRYVERTKEQVVLNGAALKEMFATDSYIISKQPKSILCAPLVTQGKLAGILYLENNLASDAFTPDRLEVLNLLSAEAAISIENARLYRRLEEANERLADYSKTLEQKVEERTQALQQKNQELERANLQVLEATRRKSQFLAGMSHELRTPMNAILGFTRLVLRRTGDILPERQRDNLVKVQESAENLLNLINDLLDLAKIEEGRMDVRPELFDVRRFIADCCETVSPLVKPAVQLRQEIATEVGEARTDKEGLHHIVLNLLGNAVKFTNAGEVVVRVRMDGQANRDKSLVIAVADTGVGIAAEALGVIFEEFQQVGGPVGNHKGTGLGLPIAKKWTELLGGSIAVESERGKGSTFTITIPAVYQRQ